MTWTDPILAFLRQHHADGVENAPDGWVRDWIQWYDVQRCLGVIHSDEGDILAVGMAVRIQRHLLAEGTTWHMDDPQGDVLLVVEICASCPEWLRQLILLLQERFPEAWKRLPVYGRREDEVRKYTLKEIVRLYVGTFLPRMTEPCNQEAQHGQDRITCPA
jgi:hypothetical protein